MRPTVVLRAQSAPPAAPGLSLSSMPAFSPPAAPPLPLTALRLRRSLAWPVGQAEVACAPRIDTPAAGDSVVIEGAADGDSVTTLFTGRVLRQRCGFRETRLLLEEATGPLARLRVDKAIRSGTAAGVISDLCQEASVTATVEPTGAQLPAFALLSNQSALEHIVRLAAMSGYLLATTAAGELHAGTPAVAPGGAVLRPVDPVLEYQVEEDPDEPSGGAISGDGAMGASGPGAETWVLQDLSAMTAGDGTPTAHVPGLKTLADVTRAATGLSMRLKEQKAGRTLILAGIPPADLGEVISLNGFATGDGPARVTGIEVLFSGNYGLTTRLELRGIGV